MVFDGDDQLLMEVVARRIQAVEHRPDRTEHLDTSGQDGLFEPGVVSCPGNRQVKISIQTVEMCTVLGIRGKAPIAALE